MSATGRVSRELLARVWRPVPDRRPHHSPSTLIRRSARPTDWPRRGARHHGYHRAGLSPAAGRRRRHRRRAVGPPARGPGQQRRGAAHFLREPVGRVRHAGGQGPTHGAGPNSGFYTHTVVAVCRRMDVRFSIAIRQRARLRNLIEAIPEDAWTPIPLLDGRRPEVAETTYTRSRPRRTPRGTAHRPAE